MNKFFIHIIFNHLIIFDVYARNYVAETKEAQQYGYSLIPSWMSNIALTFFVIVLAGYIVKIIPKNLNIFKIFETTFNTVKKEQQPNYTNQKEDSKKHINRFSINDKVFHSKFGFGNVILIDNEIVEVEFKDDNKRRKIKYDYLKKF